MQLFSQNKVYLVLNIYKRVRESFVNLVIEYKRDAKKKKTHVGMMLYICVNMKQSKDLLIGVTMIDRS